MKINADLVADIIPVDYPINLMIAVAWHLATRRYNNRNIFQNKSSAFIVTSDWRGIFFSTLICEITDHMKYRFTVVQLAIEILWLGVAWNVVLCNLGWNFLPQIWCGTLAPFTQSMTFGTKRMKLCSIPFQPTYSTCFILWRANALDGYESIVIYIQKEISERNIYETNFLPLL